MLTFFKNFGKGILYVLVLPFLVVGLAIYGVVAIFIFIYLAIKGLVLFFTGRSLYEDLPEDKEAKRRIAIQNGEIPTQPVEEQTFEKSAQEELNPNDEINNDPFYVPEYMKDEVQVEEQAKPQEEEYFEQPITPEPEPLPEEPIIPENEEILPKNTQNTNILEINEEDEDDSDDSGVTIHFD